MVFYKRAAVALVAGFLLTLAPAASAQQRTIVIVRPVHPVFFYDPFWYPYPPAYYVPETVGYVKIDTHMKDARVYVDGGYAGTVGKLKKFPLRPGNYNIVLKDSDGRSIYQERIAVFLGKTTKIRVAG